MRSKLAVVFVIALGVLLASTASAAQARSQGVKITHLFPRITQGQVEFLDAEVSRSGTCSLRLEYANGKRQTLARERVMYHEVSWTWLVSTSAAVGKATARLACTRLGVKTGTFVVKRRSPSSAHVIKRGFTQLNDGNGGTTLSWGVELVNRSQKEARNVTVYANFLEADGGSVLTDAIRVTRIGPGATFYAGSQARTAGFPVYTKLVPVVTTGRGTAQPLFAPAVTNVQVSAGFDGSAVVNGDVTNDGSKQLSTGTAIFAVFLNSTGKIVGGGVTVLSSAQPPGAQGAFEVNTAPGGPPASSVSQVKVDVDVVYGSG